MRDRTARPSRGSTRARPSTRTADTTQPPPIIEGSITAITPARQAGCVAIRVGRARAAVIAADDADRLRLHTGLQWTPALADAIAAAAALAAAKELAVKIVASRSITRAALCRRLAQRGHAPADAAKVADQLQTLGALDDARFAAAFIRSRLDAKPAGKIWLLSKLAQKGVDRATANAAADAALLGRDQRAEAERLALARLKRMSPRLERQAIERRLFGLLARRGFDAGLCRDAVRKVMA